MRHTLHLALRQAGFTPVSRVVVLRPGSHGMRRELRSHRGHTRLGSDQRASRVASLSHGSRTCDRVLAYRSSRRVRLPIRGCSASAIQTVVDTFTNRAKSHVETQTLRRAKTWDVHVNWTWTQNVNVDINHQSINSFSVHIPHETADDGDVMYVRAVTFEREVRF